MRPSRRREVAQRAVQDHGVSIRMACDAFRVSQTCYRYVAKADAENEEIANWLLRLTDNHRNWGFGLCFLYLRNVTVQQDRALRMAVPISLGRSGPRTARRHAVDVVLQSRAPKYGSGQIYPKTAVSHGRVAFLLLAIAKNGGITAPSRPNADAGPPELRNPRSIWSLWSAAGNKTKPRLPGRKGLALRRDHCFPGKRGFAVARDARQS